jgi:diketogulonate reductase-like aldo/keto reductase
MTDATSTVGLGSGGAMPLLGFGTWQLRGEECRQAVSWALEAGYRHLDTATMYRNEEQVGRALRESGVPREDVFLTTKLPPDRMGDEERTLDASLTALGVDHLDLWLIHWPPGRGVGADAWRRMARARDDGRVRAVGVSNYGLAQIDELAQTGVVPAVDQVRWSPSLHDPGFLAGCRERGVVVEGYSPFKASDLHDPVLGRVAAAHGVAPTQVIVRWHLQHEVVVIPKSVQRERIVANADVDGFALTDEEMAALDGLGAG